MVFSDNFKCAGNKTDDHAVETIMLLWEEYIQPISTSWKFTLDEDDIKNDIKSDVISQKKGISKKVIEKNPQDVHFLFDFVMRNIDFNCGFSIDKNKLNLLMNRKEYSDTICLSYYENTSTTHVNTKMNSRKSDTFMYDVLVYENGKGRDSHPHFMKSVEKLYAHKKKSDEREVTFITFSSGEIILSGRYLENMRDTYNFFTNIIGKNKDFLTETISKPKVSIKQFLMGKGFSCEALPEYQRKKIK
jgi:hypothetical protein